MKKIIIVISTLVLSLFSDDYIPLSNLSDKQKEEYNFINKNSIEKIEEDSYKKVKDIKILNNQTKEEKQELSKPINKEFVKEYKKDNILKDERKISQNNFSEDFSIIPKISYMNVSTDIEKESIEKTHEVIPEILFTYKNHNLKFDYLSSNVKTNLLSNLNWADFNLDTKWYRLAYLYSFYNVNIGLAYNYLDINFGLLGINAKDNQKFASIEAHLKNSEDNFIVEYGGFYGKNDDIKNAYEYYLTLGYKIFSNDNLIFNAGYKNRTIEDSDLKIEYKGPIIGISSKF